MKGLPDSILFEHYFDGIDDYITIDNSGTAGNPYDFERTDPFTLAVKIRNTITCPIGFSFNYIDKGNGTSGYYLISGAGGFLFGFLEGGVSKYVAPNSGYGTGAVGDDTYLIVTYDGSSNLNNIIIHLYNKLGVLGKRCMTSDASLTTTGGNLTGTIKNTQPLWFGRSQFVTTRYYTGYEMDQSIWNIVLSNTQIDELVKRMMTKSVDQHSQYGSSCKGYWKQFGRKLMNLKNPTYNGTYNGFINP